jgi:hypothetical protein
MQWRMVRSVAFMQRTVTKLCNSRDPVNEARLHCMNFRLAAREAKPHPQP